MIESILRAAIDGVLRLTANSFEILDTKTQKDDACPQDDFSSDLETRIAVQLSPAMLKHSHPQDILEALQEFSFSEALALVSGLEPSSRRLIFASLKDQYDLKSALEFGLQHENTDKPDRQAIVFYEVARHFLSRLGRSAQSAESPSPSSSLRPNTSVGEPTRLIDILTEQQLLVLTTLQPALITRLLTERHARPFASMADLTKRVGPLHEHEAQKLARLF